MQSAVLRGRVVGRRCGPRGGGRLRVWRGRGAAGVVAVGALRRGLARRLCGVVWLAGWRGRVGRRRGGCGGAGQVALLLRRRRLLPRARRLAIGVGVARRRQRLPVRAVHGRGRADAAPDGVCGHKGLRLRRHGREDAVLVEAQAVGAAAVLGGLEARAADLAAPAVATGNGSALARRGRLVVLLDVLWRGGLLAVRVLRRRGARPLVGAWETVRLLVLRVLVGGHVRARILGGRRRERRVHMRGRRRIGAVGGLLRGRRLPVRVRVHGGGGGVVHCAALRERGLSGTVEGCRKRG